MSAICDRPYDQPCYTFALDPEVLLSSDRNIHFVDDLINEWSLFKRKKPDENWFLIGIYKIIIFENVA